VLSAQHLHRHVLMLTGVTQQQQVLRAQHLHYCMQAQTFELALLPADVQDAAAQPSKTNACK
jgi:hypothetical protein